MRKLKNGSYTINVTVSAKLAEDIDEVRSHPESDAEFAREAFAREAIRRRGGRQPSCLPENAEHRYVGRPLAE